MTQDTYRFGPDATWTEATTRLIGVPICPDLLTIADLGEADTWRGRLVRLFFRLLP